MYINEEQLLTKAQELAGLKLSDLANIQDIILPTNLSKAKGLVGQLAENYLGVSAPNAPEPDFQELGIELKTLPIDTQGRPTESTYICRCHREFEPCWTDSRVHHKTRRILWLPVEAQADQPLATRRFGLAQLWSPSPEQAAQMACDWEELMEALQTGRLEETGAQMGSILQLRPKAANSTQLHQHLDSEAGIRASVPKGFYFRSSFTRQLAQTLWRCF